MPSLALPGVPAVTLRPDVAERFLCCIGGQRLAGAEHPHAAFLLQGRGAAPGPQGHFVTLDREVESVAWREVHLVSEGLGQNNAARSIKGNLGVHVYHYTVVPPSWEMVSQHPIDAYK